jgi:ribonucleotide reductase alpha subunit
MIYALKLISKKEIEGDTVYCIKEPNTRSIIVNSISTRRCGEIVLSPYDSCRLIALNLYSFVENRF